MAFKTITIKFSLIIAIGFVCVFSTNAQTKSCALSLNVLAFDKPAAGEKIPIAGAEATIKNLETQKTQKPDLTDTLYFITVDEGKLEISVNKESFKRTVKRINLNCSLAAGGRISEIVYLWKGNPKETVTLESNIFSRNGEDSTLPLNKEKALNSIAVVLGKPSYPLKARAANVTGTVTVKLLIDEEGNVAFAKAETGDPLLQPAAVKAAYESKFTPTFIESEPVKIFGFITYNFTP